MGIIIIIVIIIVIIIIVEGWFFPVPKLRVLCASVGDQIPSLCIV